MVILVVGLLLSICMIIQKTVPSLNRKKVYIAPWEWVIAGALILLGVLIR